MDFLSAAFTKSKRFVRNHPLLCAFYALVFVLFLITARYVDYPDEYVNLLAGKSILSFGAPYRDVWDHHLPFAWYLSSVLLFFSGGSFVIFRLLWAVLVFTGLLAVSFWLRKRAPKLHSYYLTFFLMYPLAALYFWFHLFLADSIAVFFFSIAFWMLFAESLHPKALIKPIYTVSFMLFCMVFSSATYLYMGAMMYLWLAYLVVFHGPHHDLKRRGISLAKLIGFSLIPYAVYALLLAVTGTLKDFYFANFVYNTTLYISIPNYVRGGLFNPLKFALTLISNFYEGYMPLISKIKYFDLYLPIGTLAGLSTLTMLFLLLKRSWIVGIIYFFILSFSAPRSNVQNYKETDYQSAMFIVLGIASAACVLYLLEELDNKHSVTNDLKRASRFLIGVFMLFSIVFLSYNSFSKAFQMYTQKLPTIHNRGEASLFIDELISGKDAYFVGPYEPNEAFYTKNGTLPGKYVSLLPQFRESDFIKQDFLNEFSKNPPKVVLFKQQSSIFGTPAVVFGKFFYEWMGTRYTQLEKVPGVQVLRQPTGFDIKTDLFIRNDAKQELLKTLTEKGYISLAQ